MGTGASSASSRSPSPEYAQSHRNSMRQHLETDENRKNSMPASADRDRWKGQNVICNDVAPIIISKDCFEEYQCPFLAEKQIAVIGAIKNGMLEHNLVQEKYFMVADQFKDIDELNTTTKYGAPNFRKAHGGYPVYGMGQPTSDGLRKVMEYLEHEKYSEILVINIRYEPVLFLKHGRNYVSYAPRERDNLTQNIPVHHSDVEDIAVQEVAIRKEIVKFALGNADNKFAFYDDLEDLSEEPHMYEIEYIEDMKTTTEVYGLHTVGIRNAYFTRIPMSSSKAPIDKAIDHLLNAVKEVPSLFSNEESLLPTIVFSGHMGAGRTTFAMSLGILIMAHQRGFPSHAYDSYSTQDQSPKLELGEFWAVMKVCSLLPDGMKRKQEVDSILDLCADMGNIREKIVECHRKLQEIQEDYQIGGQSAREYYLDNALRYMERYCYLIIFNSYLYEQFQHCFCKSFSSWMRLHPELYLALAYINTSERTAPVELITKGLRFLVADDFVGLDVLSSHREVGTSNFRKVPGLPVYGMAQPSSKGLDRVCQYLLSKKHGHSSIHSFNLRGELVIQCDSTTYTPRELASLDRNISVAGLTPRDVEKREVQLKNEILRSKNSIQVYADVAEPKKTIEFNSVSTLQEMYENQIKQTSQLHYYRIVGGFLRSGPLEKDIYRIVSVVKDLDDIFTDEDGPAILFNCQTGKEQTTVAMAIAGLIIWHKKGFPVGTKLGEQERISVPQAEYTKGEFSAVRKLVVRLPYGTQVKREVDLMLDKCSETMTPMHFHLREVIFSMFNKIKTVKGEEVDCLYQQSLDNLERYIYLILFNAYLHMQRSTNWEMPFQQWMKTYGAKVGAYDILDSLSFGELDVESHYSVSSMRDRWCRDVNPNMIVRGYIV